MSRLPQPGDVPRAARALNQRFAAALEMSEDEDVRVGGQITVNMTTGDVSGEGAARLVVMSRAISSEDLQARLREWCGDFGLEVPR